MLPEKCSIKCRDQKAEKKEIDALAKSGEAPDKRQQLNDKLSETKRKLFKPIVGCECYLARRNRFFTNRQD